MTMCFPSHYKPRDRVTLLVAANGGAKWRSGSVLSRYYTNLGEPRYTVLLDDGAMLRECNEVSMRRIVIEIQA